MKETALEWFYREISKLNVGDDARMFIAKLLEKAKEMEKEERMYTEEDMKTAMLNVIEFTEFQKNEFRKNNDYHMALDIIHAIKQETLEQ